MRFSWQFLCVIIFAAFASCSKGSTNDNATLTINGHLGPIPNNATYNYGSYLLQVSTFSSYLVESTSLNLASYVNDSVQVTMKDMGIRQNPGPELYNVITITPL